MRLIDADKLYECVQNGGYSSDAYAVEDEILEIIENQPTVNAIKISPNLTNKGFMQKSFPNMDIDLNCEHRGYVCGYRKESELRPIIWFDKKWLKEKYRKENNT